MSNEWVEFLHSKIVNDDKGGNFALLADLTGEFYGMYPAGGEDMLGGENTDLNLILQCFGDQLPEFVHINGVRYDIVKKHLQEDNSMTVCTLQQHDGNGVAIFVADLATDYAMVLVATGTEYMKFILMSSILNAYDMLR